MRRIHLMQLVQLTTRSVRQLGGMRVALVFAGYRATVAFIIVFSFAMATGTRSRSRKERAAQGPSPFSDKQADQQATSSANDPGHP